MDNVVLCPYCGAEMDLVKTEHFEEDPSIFTRISWQFACWECEAAAPAAETEGDAYAAALRRPLQEPLTLEEAIKLRYVWMENEDGSLLEGPVCLMFIWDEYTERDKLAFETFAEEGFDYIDSGSYGMHWRCWATKPTEEEREAARWDEDRRCAEGEKT